MNTKISRSMLAGIIGTAIMSLVMFVAPLMGMPKMSAPAMLAGMMGMPVIAGWVFHFMIGIIFALIYTYLFAPKIKISNLFLKGAVFGFIVFIFAQIVMAIMAVLLPMPAMKGALMLTMIGSVMAHVVYGIAVSKTVKF